MCKSTNVYYIYWNIDEPDKSQRNCIKQIQYHISTTIYIVLQKGQKNGTNTTAQHGGSRTSTNKNAQLPIVGVQSFEGQFFEIEHIMERQFDCFPLTY